MIAWLKSILGLGAAKVGRLSPNEAQEKIKGGALLLDVRTPAERQESKIPGSQSIPLDKLGSDWEKLPKNKEIICQCRSGSRSANAAQFLAGKGYTVYNLAGGIEAWKQAKLPVR